MPGRPRKLDDTAKAEVIALVSAGASRTQAAEYVGCALSTIYNEARRDENFAAELRRAALRPIIWHLQNIKQHAERSWRASAWLLERLYPHQFGRRPPDSVSRDEVNTGVNVLLDTARRVLGDEAEERIAKHFGKIGRRVQRWSAPHARPWERNEQPRDADRFEAPPQEKSDEPYEVKLKKHRRQRRAFNRKLRWHIKTGTPYREQRPDGSYYEYDMDRLRDAIEFAKPKPHPLSADWLDHCARQQRRAERKAARWSERARRGVYDLNAPEQPPSAPASTNPARPPAGSATAAPSAAAFSAAAGSGATSSVAAGSGATATSPSSVHTSSNSHSQPSSSSSPRSASSPTASGSPSSSSSFPGSSSSASPSSSVAGHPPSPATGPSSPASNPSLRASPDNAFPDKTSLRQASPLRNPRGPTPPQKPPNVIDVPFTPTRSDARPDKSKPPPPAAGKGGKL